MIRLRNKNNEGGAAGFKAAAAKTRFLSMLSFVLIVSVVFAGTANVSARDYSFSDSRQGTFTVLNDTWDAFIFNASKDSTLSVSVQVTGGGPIDIFLIDQSDYIPYKTLTSFECYEDYSKEGTRSFSFSLEMSRDRSLAVIIDNINFTSTGADSAGNVTYSLNINVAKKSAVWTSATSDTLIVGNIVCWSYLIIVAFWFYSVPKIYKAASIALKDRLR